MTRMAQSVTHKPNIAERVALFFRQVVSELRKVIWPTQKELITYTVVAIVFVTAMVAFIAAIDYGFAKAVLHVFG
jgi:preprotein translocase subunit SecE